MRRFLLYGLMFFAGFAGKAQSLRVVNPRCEYKIDPIGVDIAEPALSWELESSQQNVLQIAYRVLVSDDSSLLLTDIGNIWDSKKVNSDASIQVLYAGQALVSVKKYYWKVMTWGNKGNVSGWSSIGSWQMGLLQQDDWYNAKWIGYEEINDTAVIVPLVHQGGKKSWGPRRDVLPLMRKTFSVSKSIKSATAFICGLGHFELSVNGIKIGDHFLDPGWTNYTKHAQYVSFDVTANLQTGANAVGVMLGNGFYYIPGQRYRKMTGAYGLPKMIMRLVIEYTDGSVDNIVSDDSWRTASSPIIFSSIYGGEDYDASLEQDGWNTTGFDDQSWEKVIVTTGPPKLESQMAEPVRVMQRFKGTRIGTLKNGISVYDLSQNFSGIPAITVTGNRGDTIRITPAELVNEDGTVNQRASGSPSYFTYILKGKGEESWQPRFTYYGFRYLQVQCIAIDSTRPVPIVTSVAGLHVRNAAPSVGSFNCSNELFNRIDTLINWAIRSNTVSLFTDCPHREKLGWLEQTHLMGASVQYNYDVSNLNRKVIGDLMNAQYPDGKIPEIAPEFTAFTPPFDESPEWGSAAIILPWYNYQWYGDKEKLVAAYPMMKQYLAYLSTKDTNGILSHGLGDWYDIGLGKSGFSQMTKMGITATAMYYHDLNIVSGIASLLGHATEARYYEEKAAKVKKAFNERFFNKQELQYDSASQTANAMALYMGLVQRSNKKGIVDALIRDIRSRNNALTAGDIGYRYVLRALEDAGRSDVIFDMNSKDDVPGYGFQLAHGATALTESWQAYPSVSNNHLMLGHLMEWFYGGLCGIKQAGNSIAFKKSEIHPQPVGNITHARASYHSPYGEIVSEWKIDGSNFVLNVQIPVNTTADIYLPGDKKPIKAGSGNHVYTCKL